MTETLWAQASPTGVSGYATTTENGSYGLLFTVSASCSLKAIWFYSPSGATTLPTSTALYSCAADGGTQTLIAQNSSPSWSGTAGSGWVRDDSFPSTALSTSTYYVAQYYGASFKQGYIYTGSLGVWFPTTSSGGLVTAPAGLPSSAGNNAPYVNTTDGFPTTWWTPSANVNWLVDVEVSSGTPVAITGVSAEIVLAGGTGTLSIGNAVQVPGVSALVTIAGAPGSVIAHESVHISGAAAEIVIAGGAGHGFVQVFSPSTSGGVTTYTTFSEINNTGDAGDQHMRVLPPDSPNTGYAHAFLWLLPVEVDQGTTYGDSIATIQALNAHNNFNLTCIQPGFAIDPWYADNDLDLQTLQESFMLQLVKWAHQVLAITGTEKHYLIGFSKSGVGGQQLFLRNPGIFEKVASWDFPVGDMISRFGSDPTAVYGDETNMAVYELSDTNLTSWSSGQDFSTVNRMWIGDGNLYDSDVSAYDTTLTSHSIDHTYSSVAADSHNWAPSPGWVQPALESILGTMSVSVPGVSAEIVISGTAGSVKASAKIPGVSAEIVISGTPGSVKASAKIPGVAAEIVMAGGTGSLTAGGSVHISGTAGEIVISGTPGSVRTSAKIPGAAAGITMAGGTGAPKNSVHIPGASAEIVVSGAPGSVTALIAARIPGIAASVIIAGSPGSVKVGVPAHVAGIAAVIAFSGGAGRVRTAARETSSLFVFSQI